VETPHIKKWIRGDNPTSVLNSARTAVAAVASLLVARLLKLPEAYWAPIATLIVMQSTLGAALPISVERFIGTVLGAVAGGLAAAFFPGNALIFGIAVFIIGIVCTTLGVMKPAYRYASITLVIIMLIPRTSGPWITAFHRFVEVSLGIAVGLVVTAVWPEPEGTTMKD